MHTQRYISKVKGKKLGTKTRKTITSSEMRHNASFGLDL